jgi:hypothetical protein
MGQGQPCPRCGGENRFYLVARPRNGGAPFRICNACRYVEALDPSEPAPQVQRQLTETERQQVYLVYAAVADWAATYLWTPAGADALAYLHARGLSDETIHRARLGFHPEGFESAAGVMLWHRDRPLYEAGKLGGLWAAQSRPKGVLRGTVLFPYYDRHGRCVLLRGRRLKTDDPDAPKYLSPAGVALYAGGPPVPYLVDWLTEEEPQILVGEGEIKVLLARQAGVPAIGQPGVSYRPETFLDALRERTAIWCYDVEARKDPFVLSPGERETLAAVAACTGLDIQEQILELLRALEKAKKSTRDVEGQQEQITTLDAIEEKLLKLRTRLEAVKERRITTKVLRLPRAADEAKVEIDTFVQRYGAATFQQLVKAAKDGPRWYKAHSGGGFRYEHGGMVNGTAVANYQARITETIYKSDGLLTTAYQKVALASPSGRRAWAEILDEDWADDRKAKLALRVGLREGTFDDDAQHVLRAVRLLSNQGDPPVERRVFTCTGWELVAGKWHFLAPDGAVTAGGIVTTIKAEIDPEAVGNHYQLCGPGDASTGAQAWLAFLAGQVCPHPLALILAAQAALPVLHRFIGNAARSMVWLYNQTGALKTSLTRASVMALYGPGFTAERADGAPVPKWDATSVGLGYLVFYYRDCALLIDDYKAGMIHPEQFKRFLHNYSEGTGRTRATKLLSLDKIRPARCIVFSTAEDIPAGDPGMQARLMSIPLEPGSVQLEALTALQRAGAAGHLAAFWRGFLVDLASTLDTRGVEAVRAELAQLIAADDAALPGHKRAAGSLRQNRVAWLYLSRYLVRAGYLSATEARQLDAAHLDARGLLADSLEIHQRDARPATIFLNVLGELVGGGELVIERPEMTCPRCEAELKRTADGWYCTGTVGEFKQQCPYHLSVSRIIGFMCDDGIGVFAEKAFREVSRVRNDQRQPFAYTSTAIWQQLEADGKLVQTSQKKGGRFTIKKRNPAVRGEDGKARPQVVLLLTFDALDIGLDEGARETRPDIARNGMGSLGSLGSSEGLAHQDAEEAEGSHGILREPTAESWDPVLSNSLFEETHDPKDPTGSHAWDPTFAALPSSETGQDPKDPMNLHPSSARAPNSLPAAAAMPTGDVANPEAQALVARLRARQQAPEGETE